MPFNPNKAQPKDEKSGYCEVCGQESYESETKIIKKSYVCLDCIHQLKQRQCPECEEPLEFDADLNVECVGCFYREEK